VQRYTESNSVLLIVLLECKQLIALVAVNNKQLVSAYNLPLCILIKVL
jgi:hypothetical protein